MNNTIEELKTKLAASRAAWTVADAVYIDIISTEAGRNVTRAYDVRKAAQWATNDAYEAYVTALGEENRWTA